MKIVMTGGGTGGHFYPLIAIAESLRILASDDHIPDLKLYYFSDAPYDVLSMQGQRMVFEEVPSGKLSLYHGFLYKMVSMFHVFRGFFVALWKLFVIYPDVVIAKGGYASVPTGVAAWVLGIPLVLHESDAAPGRANMFMARFARSIFVSYKSVEQYFPAKKVLHTGQPVRRALLHPSREGVHALFELEESIPVLWVLGGSTGAVKINNLIIELLSDALYHMQIIHQTGKANFDEVSTMVKTMLKDHPYASRYHAVPFLDELSMRRVAGVANLVLTRPGSTLFEIASWGIPAIAVPFAVSNADHNRKNAYAYAAYGAAVVIEESNLKHEIVLEEIKRILGDAKIIESMKSGALEFATPHAADVIADKLIAICYEHEAPEKEPPTPISVLIEEQLENQEKKAKEQEKIDQKNIASAEDVVAASAADATQV